MSKRGRKSYRPNRDASLQLLQSVLERIHGRLDFFLDGGGDNCIGFHNVASEAAL